MNKFVIIKLDVTVLDATVDEEGLLLDTDDDSMHQTTLERRVLLNEDNFEDFVTTKMRDYIKFMTKRATEKINEFQQKG
jgi:hypothetical protein